MAEYETTGRSTLRRHPDRGTYDRAAVHAIIDEALVAHVGFVGADGQPFVIPTSHARADETLYFHGTPGSRLLRAIQSGAPICVTFTLLDGLVLARSWTHHSVNFRSAVVFGHGRKVTDRDERRLALAALIDHTVPGRTADTTLPTTGDLRATGIAALEIEEASAKIRAGGPNDDAENVTLPIWAGVVPLTLAAGKPVPAEDLPAGVRPPPSVAHYSRPSPDRPGSP